MINIEFYFLIIKKRPKTRNCWIDYTLLKFWRQQKLIINFRVLKFHIISFWSKLILNCVCSKSNLTRFFFCVGVVLKPIWTRTAQVWPIQVSRKTRKTMKTTRPTWIRTRITCTTQLRSWVRSTWKKTSSPWATITTTAVPSIHRARLARALSNRMSSKPTLPFQRTFQPIPEMGINIYLLISIRRIGNNFRNILECYWIL